MNKPAAEQPRRLRRAFVQRGGQIGQAKQPRHHPRHVGVHGQHRLLKGDCRHRRRGIGIKARQLGQQAGLMRPDAAMLMPQHLRRRVQLVRPPIIAQPRPGAPVLSHHKTPLKQTIIFCYPAP